jgi:hypothetical protein
LIVSRRAPSTLTPRDLYAQVMNIFEPKVVILLADAAQISDGKLNMLGAGWSMITTPTGPFAVVIHAQIPWTLTNTKMAWSLDLIDSDGHPVALDETQGPIHMEGFVESGTTIYVPFVFPFLGMPLVPGKYEWHFKLDEIDESYSFLARN